MSNLLPITDNTLIEQLPGYVLWKDMNSVYLKGNLNTARLFGFKHIDELTGITDYELPCKAAEDANLFIEQDKKTKEHASTLVLDIRCYANDQIKALLINKSLFFDPTSKPLGIVCNCLEINNHTLKDIGILLSKTDTPSKKTNTQKASNFYLNASYEGIKLSKRQSQCLFYLLRGKTIKTIANILNLSPRTIETYIDDIKNKMHCRTKEELIEKAIASGFLETIPAGVITDQLNCILRTQ